MTTKNVKTCRQCKSLRQKTEFHFFHVSIFWYCWAVHRLPNTAPLSKIDQWFWLVDCMCRRSWITSSPPRLRLSASGGDPTLHHWQKSWIWQIGSIWSEKEETETRQRVQFPFLLVNLPKCSQLMDKVIWKSKVKSHILCISDKPCRFQVTGLRRGSHTTQCVAENTSY